jgi:hypothetical protein
LPCVWPGKFFQVVGGILVEILIWGTTCITYEHSKFRSDQLEINPLKTKRICLVLRTQRVPRCKHSPLRL